MGYRIKNWGKFQHFKDRRPLWIKLYRDILDNAEWHRLPAESAKGLVSIWLIGSESNGLVPDLESLAFRLRLSEKATEKILTDLFVNDFLVDSSDTEDLLADETLTPAQQIAKKNGFGSRYIPDEMKRFVLARDKAACVECGSKDRLEFDHREPISRGGESVVENLQIL